jgi:tetratricopeptide (TPR) repeat protein
VEGGVLDDAEQTLAKVIHDVPNSSEAEYFIGRIAFARGRGPDALTHFDRALSLDSTQANFHLYAARAALAMQNLGRTHDEVELAMSRDPTLGDAYWVRGIVRLRTGAVKDALKDLERALTLKPSRYEAYASIAECYDQLRMLPQAVEAYHTALAKDPGNGEWWAALARVHIDAGQTGPGAESLKKAIAIGDAAEVPPYWLAETYRLLAEVARAADNKKAAIPLYERYLKLAPSGALDRKEVQRLLLSWGVELPTR